MNKFHSLRYRAATAALVLLAFSVPASASEQVPFKGNAKGVITGIEVVGTVLHLTGTATGQATHLGHYIRHESVAIDGLSVEGSLVFLAANGDRLCARVSGGFIGDGIVAGTYTFTGGTGRFANATGEVNFLAVLEGLDFAVLFAGGIDF
jgi:hypothetical protein